MDVLDRNVVCGVMGAKTSTEGLQERMIAETFAGADNSYQSFAQKCRRKMVLSPKRHQERLFLNSGVKIISLNAKCNGPRERRN